MNKEILQELQESKVRLVAVTKTRTVSEIMPLYQAGIRDFGENRVQELLSKKDEFPSDVRWHLIGHLQSNKVKSIIPFIYLIHSVDSLDLYKTILKEAEKHGKEIRILLQFYIAKEETKFGLDYDEAEEMIQFHLSQKERIVKICGVMGMATLTEDVEQIRNEFSNLKKIFGNLKTTYFPENADFCEISMGMSSDYKIAIEEGATMVRIGSLLYG